MPKYILTRDLFGLKKGTEITPDGYIVPEPTKLEDFSITRGYSRDKMFTAFEVYILLKDGVIREEGETTTPSESFTLDNINTMVDHEGTGDVILRIPCDLFEKIKNENI